MEKIFYTYKITNLVNQKYYLGKRSFKGTTAEDDFKYLGSGKLIQHAIKKYGKENFKKEILNLYLSIEELNLAEKILITEREIADKNCYNVSLGGHGGNLGSLALEKLRITMKTDEYKRHMSDALNKPEVKEKISKSLKETMSDPEWKKKFSKIQKEAQNRPDERERNSRNQKIAQNRPEVKEARSLATKSRFDDINFRMKHKLGVNSTAFKEAQTLRGKDTKWINNTVVQKYVKIDVLDEYLKAGWILGMLKRKNI